MIVRLAGPEGLFDVTVERTRVDAAGLTCAAPGPSLFVAHRPDGDRTGPSGRSGHVALRHRPRAELLPPHELQVDVNLDSPANNVGPWPASLGCTMNSYSSISPSSAKASGSVTPPTYSPSPGCRLSSRTASPRSPAHELGVPVHLLQGAGHDVLLRRVDRPAEGRRPLGPRLRRPRRAPGRLHHLVGHAAEDQGVGLRDRLRRMAVRLFVRGTRPVVDAAVQRDVDGVSKRSHGANLCQLGSQAPVSLPAP